MQEGRCLQAAQSFISVAMMGCQLREKHLAIQSDMHYFSDFFHPSALARAKRGRPTDAMDEEHKKLKKCVAVFPESMVDMVNAQTDDEARAFCVGLRDSFMEVLDRERARRIFFKPPPEGRYKMDEDGYYGELPLDWRSHIPSRAAAPSDKKAA